MSIDNRLIDYYLHSREWGFVDRIPESVSTGRPDDVSGWAKITAGPGHRVLTVPESEAEFLDGALKDQPFPIGEEI